MCGRFTLAKPPRDLAKLFQLAEPPEELLPRYNIAPSQFVAVVGRKPDGSGRGLVNMSWGFVPRWAKSPKDGPRPINARYETIRTSPPFRDSFKDRRCLIPADGYFEWKRPEKIPFHIRPAEGEIMAFAGIWDYWKGDSSLYTCAIITVPANESMRQFHERMPAILRPDQYDAWLDPATFAADAFALLGSAADDFLLPVQVGSIVNYVKNDSPDCIAPAA